jgi:hypothetical protein
VTIHPDFRDPPAHLVLTVPWFVELESVRLAPEKHRRPDASSTAAADDKHPVQQNGQIFLPPDTTHISLRWKIKNETFAGTYQNLLKMYRSEYASVGKYPDSDKIYRTEPPPTPHLTDREKSHPPERLSFDLVRKAFTHEYTRRFKAYAASGGTVDKAQPPKNGN